MAKDNRKRSSPPSRPGSLTRQPPIRKARNAALSDEAERDQPITGRPVSVDLQSLLKAHAAQSSSLADEMARVEIEMLAFTLSGEATSPETTLQLIHSFEKVRRSAAEDLRRTARLLAQLNAEPVPVQVAVVSPQHAQVVVQQPSPLGPAPRRKIEGK